MKPTEWSIIFAPLRAIYVRFWAAERWLLIGTALIVLGSAITEVMTPYVFSRLIDGLGAGEIGTTILLAFVGYAVLRGVTTALDYCVNYLSIIAAENLNFITSTAFFAELLKKPISFFIEHNPVEVQSARNKGENAVYMVVQLLIIVFVPGLTLIALSVAMLGAVINLEMALIVLAYGSIFIGLTYLSNKWTRPLLDHAIEANQDNARFVGNAMTAMETLRYFNGDRWISQRFGEKADLSRASWVRWSSRRMGLSAVFGLALAAQLALTFFLLLPRFSAGELSVGDIVLINTMLIQLNRPFEMIGSAIDDVMRALSNFRPFAKMWNEPNDRVVLDAQPLDLKRGELAFEGVSFAYGDKQILNDLNFTAGPGRITFLSGETGAGKSTAFKLALKALEPASGRITIDGIDLANVTRESWYAHIGVVPQEVMLLSDTLGANIVLGRDYDEARLREVAEKAHILPFIDRLPDGFATTVGERGLKLSGGERQRVAIARALYGEPKMLLLDEASSALDEVTEASIVTELRELKGDVTILAITHRKSVIAPTDQVIQFAGGSGARDRVETADENETLG
ncbi:ABC transporter ATP-binding protein [Devosia epidermidihirudinis]|uniref:ABC transporter ATP-binding protein n=1 Tax=Devosia epidermidihirudinis TaxID=1293439 RepID=A0A0F5QK33_9HYPH|nr:ABC transporter ATP-binding protein [Devosia epidermidihirudinis]KKC41033.1 ABC transporter ATP-binding protein [Devosia epidermidihirudinis]